MHASALAFADRQRRPSVDRAHLRGFDPVKTKFNSTDAVVSITAQKVRAIRGSRNDAKGNPIQEYVADVEPKPEADNPSHAEIYGRPEFDNDKLFRRIRESLAFEVTWEILPAGYQHE